MLFFTGKVCACFIWYIMMCVMMIISGSLIPITPFTVGLPNDLVLVYLLDLQSIGMIISPRYVSAYSFIVMCVVDLKIHRRYLSVGHA